LGVRKFSISHSHGQGEARVSVPSPPSQKKIKKFLEPIYKNRGEGI
jgi:hypothetical protein